MTICFHVRSFIRLRINRLLCSQEPDVVETEDQLGTQPDRDSRRHAVGVLVPSPSPVHVVL